MPYQTKRIRLFFIFLWGGLMAFSQEAVLDSLLKELETHTTKDTVRVSLLVNTAWNMTHTKPEDAFVYVEEALDISTDLNWPRGRASALRQKGNLYYVMADNLNAMEAFQQGLRIAREGGEKILEASLYGNLGNIHADMKQNEKALENYYSYLATAKELDQLPDQVRALSNIGLIYNDMDQYDKGISFLKEALSIARAEGNNYFIAAIINNLGIAYKDKKEYKTALLYYEEAATLAGTIQNKYIEASALNSIGKVNILLENYEVALERAKHALQISEEIAAVEWQADAWQVLSTSYEQLGNSKEALVAYKNHVQFRDSVLSEEKKAELTRKEMQFQLEKQEAEAQAAIGQQRLIKNGVIIGGIALLIAAVLGYLLYKRRRDALEQKKLAEFHTRVAETELKALRSQMNPHFIFNALNSISDYMSKNDLATANEYLLKFSRLTRAILENSEKKRINLEEDLELTQLYIQIEALRLKNKLSHTVTVDKDIDMENTLVPPMLLQPFIENSIWHGIAHKDEKGHIAISVKKEGDMVVCTVDDDGIGRDASRNGSSAHTSMGVKITENRLDILGRLKKAKGSIAMFDKKQGLRVELKLPLELRF
ncbi:tetratricopeptide repeat protein [Flavobacteriaceae bacterium 3-367]